MYTSTLPVEISHTSGLAPDIRENHSWALRELRFPLAGGVHFVRIPTHWGTSLGARIIRD